MSELLELHIVKLMMKHTPHAMIVIRLKFCMRCALLIAMNPQCRTR